MTRSIRSSDPRIPHAEMLAIVSVRCAYWVLSQRALCSPFYA